MSTESEPSSFKLLLKASVKACAPCDPGVFGQILVARVSPLSFHLASRVKASCFPPTYVRAVSTSLYPAAWKWSRNALYSVSDVVRAPSLASGPKVMRPRMTLGFGLVAMRGIVDGLQWGTETSSLQEGIDTVSLLTAREY